MEGELAVPRNYAAIWRILDAGSDQPHQQADQRKSAEQHGPIAHVELKKTTVCRNLHIREHGLLCCIAMDWLYLINLPRTG